MLKYVKFYIRVLFIEIMYIHLCHINIKTMRNTFGKGKVNFVRTDVKKTKEAKDKIKLLKKQLKEMEAEYEKNLHKTEK